MSHSTPWSRPPEDLSAEPLLKHCGNVELAGQQRPSIGPVTLLSKLGHGGMGVVYHGFHQRLGTEVAIKLLPIAAHAQSPGLVDRFQREAQLAARIRSEHLVGVLDVDEDTASGSYATGDDEASLARAGWFKGNSGGTTQPVGRKIPNAFGLFDVHGNVWEWCSDWYGPYAPGDATDPTGAVSGTQRMLKGGTWFEHAGYARVAMRLRIAPRARKQDIGLRPIRTVPPD